MAAVQTTQVSTAIKLTPSIGHLPEGHSTKSSLSANLDVPVAECFDEKTDQSPDRQIGVACPDGGLRAWIVVFGGACNMFATFGVINSWGTFQAYYQQNGFHDTPASSIAWIGSLQYSLMCLPGLVAGRLLDRGYHRMTLALASAVLVVATCVVGNCNLYWQLFLLQGVISGIACGMIYGPTAAVVSQWFLKRRATALGIMSTGSSVGGTIFPILINYLLKTVGYAWTMRTMACVLTLALGVSNVALRTRLPPKQTRGKLLPVSVFKSLIFAVHASSALLTFLGSTTFLTFVNVSAISAGLRPNIAAYMLTISNASSIIGRVGSGLLGDRFGAMNILAPFTAVAGLVTLIWPIAHNTASLAVISALYGIGGGAYMSLSPIPLMHLEIEEDIGGRIGVFQSVMSVGALVGAPISGAIYDHAHTYAAVGAYAGTMILSSVALMLLTRYLILRRFRGKC